MFHSRDLARLPAHEREEFLASLTNAEAEELAHKWAFWARDEQMTPPGDWIYWMPLAGRGWGKTRTGAETVRQWIADGFSYVNLVGATTDDVIGTMIEGESGILNICPKDERPRLNGGKRRLEWPNGAVSIYFSAEEPNRLRGKQHMKLWCDELAAWRYPDAWDQAVFGLRIGAKPQAIITTTPRPTKIMRDLLSDPLTHQTHGSTYENLANLAESFIHKVVRKYEGTRLGRQELNAEMLLDMPGALWSREMLDAARWHPVDSAGRRNSWPTMRRIVVAVDPPVTSGDNADECGICVAGLLENGGPCIIADLTCQGETPMGWATKAVEAAKKYHADCIVGEVNNGGELVETLIHQINPNVRFKAVWASQGKYTRAEPVAMFYEQGRAIHMGVFPKLEDQMCLMTPDFDRKKAGYSPDRVDSLAWAVHELCLAPGDGTAIIDHYKALAEKAKLNAPESKKQIAAANHVALLAPPGPSSAYGMTGAGYSIPADRIIHVHPDDVAGFRSAGFVDPPTPGKQDGK